ncbi:unnamed protein product, partial [marine sediment metagenome]
YSSLITVFYYILDTNYAISNSFGFGGHNGVIVLGKYHN